MTRLTAQDFQPEVPQLFDRAHPRHGFGHDTAPRFGAAAAARARRLGAFGRHLA